MATAQINGSSTHFEFDESAGSEKPVLIFSNSLGTNLSMWDPQAASLKDRYRILRYDTRGHGDSSVSQGPYTIAQLGQDVLDLMDHLNVAQASFCGLSMGGMIGSYLAINAQGRFDKFVLANTNAFTASPEFWANRIKTLMSDGGIQAIADGVMARFFSPSFAERNPATVARIKRDMLETPLDGYVACCAAIRDMDFRSGLHEIQTPTLVISGKNDQASPPENGRFLAEHIPGSKYLELDAAHISNIEVPAAFTAELMKFIG